MQRTFSLSDQFYRLSHAIKRNRSTLIVYALCCTVFLVIGIAIGVNMDDKCAYILQNGAPIFRYLRGESGAIVFFLLDLLFSVVYALFASGMFFFRPLALVSFAPCMYKSYSLGIQVCVIIGVYSGSALPMLFVFFVPIEIIEICIYCVLSYRCRRFAAVNCRCMPTKIDIIEYYKSLFWLFIAMAVCVLVKIFTAVLFCSAMIGVL